MAIVKVDIKTDMHGSTAKVEGFDKALGGMRGRATDGGKALKGMWKQMAAGIGVTAGITLAVRAMVNQVKDVFNVGREFEKGWANVTTMLNISREATQGMRSELLRLSPTLGDTTDLAAGMYQVLSASIEPAKAIKFLGEAAKSAKAGVTETKVAVDALTTVINAYGMEAEDVTEISDVMFGVVKRGKLTYDEMASSLGTIVPIAAQLGVGFREIGAAMATMTRKGIDAQTATMQLRQVLMAVLSASDKVKQKAEDLDFEFTALALRTKGLSKFLADLKEATKGNNELLREFLPNVRAVSGVMALGGEGARGLADDLEFLQEVIGLTNEAFEKQMDSIDFWIETAGVAFDKFKIAFFEGLVSPLREGIRTTEDFEEKFTEKTNEIADSVSLFTSAFVEGFGAITKAGKETINFLDWWVFGWIEKSGEVSEEFVSNANAMAEAIALRKQLIKDDIITSEEWTAMFEKHGKSYARVLIAIANHPAYETLRNQWEGTEEEITNVAGDIVNDIRAMSKEAEGFATSYEDVWARVRAIELEILWRNFALIIKNVKMADKELIEFGDTTETTALEIAENIGFMKSEMDLWIETTRNASEAQQKWTELALGEFLAMQAGLKGFVNAILGVFEQWAIGQVIPITMKLPFPASLIAMGVAIAAIKTAFAGIKGLAEGGMVGLHGPEIIKVGERGPERVLSNREIRSSDSQGISTTYNVTLNQYIYPKELTRETIRRSGSWLWSEMDRQIKRGQQSG